MGVVVGATEGKLFSMGLALFGRSPAEAGFTHYWGYLEVRALNSCVCLAG